MNVLIVAHNGVGDNLTMIGAVNFLTQFYNEVHYVCSPRFISNVKTFFDSPKITCLPFHPSNPHIEFDCIKTMVSNYSGDVIICGYHKSYVKSKITIPLFLEYKVPDEKYSIDIEGSDHVKQFYKDANMNLKCNGRI